MPAMPSAEGVRKQLFLPRADTSLTNSRSFLATLPRFGLSTLFP